MLNLCILLFQLLKYNELFIYLFYKIKIIKDINLTFNKIDRHITYFYL